MATGQVSSPNTAALLRKELAVGLLNGLVFSVVVAAIAILWYGDLALGLMLAAAILLNLPAGGVVLTTVTDVIGSGAFIGLATFMLLGR
jgi:magnesium transporter